VAETFEQTHEPEITADRSGMAADGIHRPHKNTAPDSIQMAAVKICGWSTCGENRCGPITLERLLPKSVAADFRMRTPGGIAQIFASEGHGRRPLRGLSFASMSPAASGCKWSGRLRDAFRLTKVNQ